MRTPGLNSFVRLLIGLQLLSWRKNTTTYPIRWLGATIFLSDFALVAAYDVQGIVREKKYGMGCVWLSSKGMVNGFSARQWVDG